MVRPHAKGPFCPDPRVTVQVLRLRRASFWDEIGIASNSFIEPQTARPDGISIGMPLTARMPTKTRPPGTWLDHSTQARFSVLIRLNSISCVAIHILRNAYCVFQ